MPAQPCCCRTALLLQHSCAVPAQLSAGVVAGVVAGELDWPVTEKPTSAGTEPLGAVGVVPDGAAIERQAAAPDALVK